jgi:hypothetical protein
MDGLSEILLIHQVVTLEHPQRFMAGDDQDPEVVDARAPGVGHKGMA